MKYNIKREKKINKKHQYIKCGVVLALYIAFLIWVKSWLGIIVIPFIIDAYITKKIKWHWWKDSEGVSRIIMGWVDAIVFALVAVYFINIFFFQNYVIPSSSLEKSLVRGDYLFVSKLSYGPRVPQTPLTMPLTQHTLPIFGIQSYIEWPQWEYKRVNGLGTVELNDIVVFNYPAGDTVMVNPQYQAQDYYQACFQCGVQMMQKPSYDSIAHMPKEQQTLYLNKMLAIGRQYIVSNKQEFGGLKSRPVDRRENYVKRCVGLPGQTLEIKNKVVYLNGKANKEPDNVQYDYWLKLKPGAEFTDDLMERLNITMEDLESLNQSGFLPLTNAAYKELKAMKNFTENIIPVDDTNFIDAGKTYPVNAITGWTRDNYGPVWIPQKGKSITLTLNNIAVYERPIRVYENNTLEIKGNKIFINGKKTNKYTFKMDYYWMMGDNRHNSLDSRYWGFVPEDHIVGKPIFIWLSINPESVGAKIRWNRMFRMVDDIK